MSHGFCPVTHMPLIKPSHVVSDAALNLLTTQTMHLASTMTDLVAWLAAKPPHGEGSGGKPTSRPPLSLHKLERISDHQGTLNQWARLLLQRLSGGVYTPNDWIQAQAIYQAPRVPDYRHATQTWPEAARMIDEVLDALKQIERAMTPPQTVALTDQQREEAVAALEVQWYPLPKALDLYTQIYGTPPQAATVRKWKERGRIRTLGQPPHYRVSDIRDLTAQSH